MTKRSKRHEKPANTRLLNSSNTGADCPGVGWSTISYMAENIFEVYIPLRWGDMDAYGHVNNVTVLQILEEARIAVFGAPPSAGEPVESSPTPRIELFAQLPDGVQALVSENHLRYLAPVLYRNLPVRVEVTLQQVKAASLTLSYRLFDQFTGALCVTATTTLAFFNAHTGILHRLSAEQRAHLKQYLSV